MGKAPPPPAYFVKVEAAAAIKALEHFGQPVEVCRFSTDEWGAEEKVKAMYRRLHFMRTSMKYWQGSYELARQLTIPGIGFVSGTDRTSIKGFLIVTLRARRIVDPRVRASKLAEISSEVLGKTT